MAQCFILYKQTWHLTSNTRYYTDYRLTGPGFYRSSPVCGSGDSHVSYIQMILSIFIWCTGSKYRVSYSSLSMAWLPYFSRLGVGVRAREFRGRAAQPFCSNFKISHSKASSVAPGTIPTGSSSHFGFWPCRTCPLLRSFSICSAQLFDFFNKKLKNVSCEYDRLNGWN